MLDFQFYSPTQIVFGKDAINQVGELTSKLGKRVLIVYGQHSVIKSGLLSQIKNNLQDLTLFELGGVQPNPVLSLVYQGISICKNEKIDAILAVGGGSVIDTAKAVAMGTLYDGDVWDFFVSTPITQALPIGAVLTIAAAGSETSPNTVITKEDGLLKWGTKSDVLRPKFALLNPEFTFTLSKYQTACGIADIFAHIIERYFTQQADVDLTDKMSEGALQSIIKNAAIVMENPNNYTARAEIMLAGALAHNGIFGMGRVEDWCSHAFGREISALYDTAHGATLSIAFPAWMRYVYKHNVERFAQFAAKVFDVPFENSLENMAIEGISRFELFMKSLELPTKLNDIGIDDKDILLMSQKCTKGRVIGGFIKIDEKMAEEIYRGMAAPAAEE